MSQLREPHHFSKQMRKPFLTDSQRVRMERQKEEEHLKEVRRQKERKLSNKIVITIAGVTAALVALRLKLKDVLEEHPTCPAPKKFAVAKPPPAAKYPPVIPPTCGMTEKDELEELRKATKNIKSLREYLKEAEEEIKDVSNYKRSTLQKLKEAAKNS